jgi:glycine cleavage system regulatory protein
MSPLVLTYVGDDRPGLVGAVSETIAAYGGTWLESRSARLAGKFAGILLVNVPEANIAALEQALGRLAPAGLNLTIERGAAEEAKAPARLITLDILGNERPGIVRDVTQTLTTLGVNIEEFESRLESAAFTGVQMFRARARLRAPETLPLEDLRKTLERLAGEIMVDLTMAEAEPSA